MRALYLIALGICAMCVQTSLASDLAKEKRWADQVVDALLDGEGVYLNDGRAEFLAIETGCIRTGRPWSHRCASA